MPTVTWANEKLGKLTFWLHVAVRRGIRPSVDDQLGITSRASPDSSGYIFATQTQRFCSSYPLFKRHADVLGLRAKITLARQVGATGNLRQALKIARES
jgi:hypothetical protein